MQISAGRDTERKDREEAERLYLKGRITQEHLINCIFKDFINDIIFHHKLNLYMVWFDKLCIFTL